MLIVNPNLATDRTIPLDELQPGHVQRTGAAAVTLGGKGVNVARIARSFGRTAVIVGFLPQQSVGLLTDLARAEGAELRGVTVTGTVRGASILLERSGRVTVLNEPGPAVSEEDWNGLLIEVKEQMAGHLSVACSGSVPPGSPPDGYARIVAAAHRAGLRVVVDSSGEALSGSLAASPDVVSPSLAEAEALLFGASVEVSEPSRSEAMRRAANAVSGLIGRGARHAIVSAGEHGVAFDHGSGIAWCPAPKVDVVNPIGAGDSLVGGLIDALEGGQGWPDAVRTALVVASASCEQELAGGVDLARVDTLLADLPPTRVLAGRGDPSGPGGH